jgi:hypothetical protein
MPNQGYRSVEVTVINDTRGDLTVNSPGTAAGSTWIQGEKATQGDGLNQYASSVWGVSTNDPQGTAMGHAQLTGLGSFPVALQFVNNHNGNSDCNLTDNDQVTGHITMIDTGERNHSAFTVQLVPLVQAAKPS